MKQSSLEKSVRCKPRLHCVAIPSGCLGLFGPLEIAPQTSHQSGFGREESSVSANQLLPRPLIWATDVVIGFHLHRGFQRHPSVGAMFGTSQWLKSGAACRESDSFIEKSQKEDQAQIELWVGR